MRVQVHTSGFLGRVMVFLLGAVLLLLVFMFSMLVLAPVVLIGSWVLGYQLRKIKGLHKQMREQSPDGHVIEGEVIYEATEAEQLKSVRILSAD